MKPNIYNKRKLLLTTNTWISTKHLWVDVFKKYRRTCKNFYSCWTLLNSITFHWDVDTMYGISIVALLGNTWVSVLYELAWASIVKRAPLTRRLICRRQRRDPRNQAAPDSFASKHTLRFSIQCSVMHYRVEFNYFALNPAVMVVGPNLPARPKPKGLPGARNSCLIQNFPAWPLHSHVAWQKKGWTWTSWTMPFRILLRATYQMMILILNCTYHDNPSPSQ